MRKEDRIRMSHQQDRSMRGPDDKTSMDPRGREQVKGSGSSEQPQKPQRPPGSKLPLPD